MPELNWIGKQHVVNHAEEVPFRLLRKEPDSSEGVADSGNMIVHGDNLEALKALFPYYRNRVKLVFIDPPYNTGNEDWAYNDKMNAPKLKKWFGKVVGGEGEDLSRHDKWLCMMYPRLELLRDLLASNGSLWMTVDDNEAHYAKVLMDEIFGRANFLANVVWEKADSPRMDAEFFSVRHDHLLVYAKDRTQLKLNRTRAENGEVPEHYDKVDEEGRRYYLKPLRAMSSRDDTREARPSMYYDLEAPDGSTVFPKKADGSDGRWRWGREKYEAERGRVEWINGRRGWAPYYRIYAQANATRPPETIWSHEAAGSNRTAIADIKALFGGANPFDTPKPVRLLQRVLQAASERDSIVLDSFAGSGTTAHAVLKQNAEDGGERRFVLVEMEDYSHSLTAERVRRVIQGEGGQPFLGSETGFDFYELGSELFTPLGDRIDSEVDKEALGRFAFFMETGLALGDGAAGTFGANGAAFVGGGRDRNLYLFYEPGGTTVFGEEESGRSPTAPPGTGSPRSSTRTAAPWTTRSWRGGASCSRRYRGTSRS